MDKENATETNVPPIATEDAEARYAKLEEEKENYRKAYLKASEKTRKSQEENLGEDEEEKMRRIAREALADSKLVEIAREQDEIIKKTLKENKELKLAQLNKTTTPPAQIGTHSEAEAVKDTLVTPEQMAYFKNTLKWTDKDIEGYKKRLLKGGGR